MTILADMSAPQKAELKAAIDPLGVSAGSFLDGSPAAVQTATTARTVTNPTVAEGWLLARRAGSQWNDTGKIDVFVDPATGSDTNPGTELAPRATIAGVVQAPGLVIGLKRTPMNGTPRVLREKPNLLQDGMQVVAYGSGDRPVIINSTKITGTWTLTGTTNVWSMALATAPNTVLLIANYGQNGVTKLWKFPQSQIVGPFVAATTAPVAGQFGYSASTLYVYSTVDPGTLAEVSYTVLDATSTGIGVQMNGNNLLMQDIAVWGSASDGVYFGSGKAGCVARGCHLSYNTSDGTGSISHLNLLREYNLITDNGWNARDESGADGDGISDHGNADATYSSGINRYNTILRNRKSGIGSQTSSAFDNYGNYLDNNYWNIALFVQAYTGGVALVNRFWNNIVINRANDAHGAYLGGVPNYANDTQFYNNTFWASAKVTGKAGFRGIESALSSVTWKNNITYGFDRGFDVRGSANLSMDYNLFFGNTATYFDNSTGYLTGKTGANSQIADPNFVDPVNGILSLRPTSIARGAGTPISFITENLRQNPITGNPDIGAL